MRAFLLEQVIPYLYSLHEDKWEVFNPEPFQVIYSDESLKRLLEKTAITIQQSQEFKIKYLHDRYHFTRQGDRLVFNGTCLEWIDTQQGIIQWRKRSEWFRKFPSDFAFASSLCDPGLDLFTCQIPRLWIRPLSSPLVMLWGEDNKQSLWPHHLREALKTIGRYPPERLVFLQHRLTRRLLLRYYYRMGYWPDPERRHFHFSRSARTPVPKKLEFNPKLDYSNDPLQRFSFGNSVKEIEE